MQGVRFIGQNGRGTRVGPIPAGARARRIDRKSTDLGLSGGRIKTIFWDSQSHYFDARSPIHWSKWAWDACGTDSGRRPGTEIPRESTDLGLSARRL
jgi:hypothetical protein